MGLNKLIVVIGIAAFVMQPTNSASIGALNNNCICTREYFPICGSDDTTYSNTCEYECAKEHRMDLDIKFYGQCEDGSKPLIEEIEECVCSFILDPVCGSDGTTYASYCELSCAKKLNRNLEVFAKGECVKIEQLPVEEVEKMHEAEECACTFILDPVCGSDGTTYASECELSCAKKLNRNLEVFAKGECVEIEQLPVEEVEKMQEAEECICTREYAPVCGTDGNTYSNECIFNCAKTTKKSLDVEFMGEC